MIIDFNVVLRTKLEEKEELKSRGFPIPVELQKQIDKLLEWCDYIYFKQFGKESI
jgi:hypothetical protein